MKRNVKIGVGVAAGALVLAAAGVGVAVAGPDDQDVTRPAADQARAAAVQAVPSGTAGRVEQETGEGAAFYGVMVTKPDGTKGGGARRPQFPRAWHHAARQRLTVNGTFRSAADGPVCAVMTTSTLAVPSPWAGVATSLLLVAVAAAVAYRQRLGLTREIVVAAAGAGVQLIAVGAILLVLFLRAGLLGAAGWVAAIILIAGEVAGRRGVGVSRARTATTVGVAAGTVVTLGALLAAGVIAQLRTSGSAKWGR